MGIKERRERERKALRKEIVEAICGEDFLTLAKCFREIAGIADLIGRLNGAGNSYAEFALEHPHHYRLMFMTPHPP